MASCITEQWDGRSAPRLQLTVNIKSTSGNKVTLAWEVDYVAHDSYAASTGSPRSYSVVINGTKVVSGTYDINGIKGIRTIKSGTYDVTKSTSAKKISFSCSMAFNLTWSGNYAGTKSASGTIDIPKMDSYSITYNANGGTGAPNVQTKWHGTDITLSSAKPSRVGYTFSSWNTRKDGTAKTYNPGDKYTTDAASTLYAIWIPIKYTVSFNANSNGDTVENLPTGQQKSHGVNLTITNKTPTRTNYNFLGWGTSASATTVSYAPGSEYTKDAPLTLYSIWSPSYTKPRITNTKAYRCLADGSPSDSGTYIKITFDWETDLDVTALRYQYKLLTDKEWVETLDHALPAEGESMRTGSVTDIVLGNADTLIFATDKAYKIDILVADAGGYSYHIQTVNEVTYPIDVLKGGKGVAIGKTASTTKFDVGMETNFDKNVKSQKSFYELDKYKCYSSNDVIPLKSGGTGGNTAEQGAKNLGYGKMLYNGGAWMTSEHSWSLSESVSTQPHGIILAFSECVGNKAQNKGWNHFFISKKFVIDRSGEGSAFPLATYNFDVLGVKHLFIFSNKIIGSDENSQKGTANGITYDNTRFMLRYIIGV